MWSAWFITVNSENSGSFGKGHSAALAHHYLSHGFWRDETLVDVAKRRIGESPTKTLIIEGGTSFNREAASNQALKLAAFLQIKDLVKSDVISFQLPNWSETVVIALAARMLGLIINPIPPIYRESEISYILNDCRSKILFLPDFFRGHNYRAMIARVLGNFPNLVDIVFLRCNSNIINDWQRAISAPPMPVEALPKVNAASIKKDVLRARAREINK